MEVLVYSKEEKFCRMIHSFFAEQIMLVHTLGEAKRWICSRKISVVIIDLEQAGEEGIALAHYLREIHRHYLTPIIFLADDDAYEREAFREIRCYDYLCKPVRPEMLREVVNLLCDKLDPNCIPKSLVIRLRNDVYRFEISDVVYLEIFNKKLIIHTQYEDWDFPYRPIRECVGQGRGELVQCHRAMAVNRHYVERVDDQNRNILLKGRGDKVLLGPKYMRGIRSLFDRPEESGYT